MFRHKQKHKKHNQQKMKKKKKKKKEKNRTRREKMIMLVLVFMSEDIISMCYVGLQNVNKFNEAYMFKVFQRFLILDFHKHKYVHP